ncbi:MAG: hypothetical protein M2R45_01340 [Verrucomicrobia subdivision 3 bacterium]|nr:hypothetical protein [Limisphaerales bacterium]MCS1415205.1 hypothetical protein [Limisphaerales bacterium]
MLTQGRFWPNPDFSPIKIVQRKEVGEAWGICLPMATPAPPSLCLPPAESTERPAVLGLGRPLSPAASERPDAKETNGRGRARARFTAPAFKTGALAKAVARWQRCGRGHLTTKRWTLRPQQASSGSSRPPSPCPQETLKISTTSWRTSLWVRNPG